MSSNLLVIGAINIDILAHSKEELLEEDSNLAEITLAFGGVAGNIASNLAFLGMNPHMLTTLGDDHFSDLIVKRYAELSIHLSAQVIENRRANIYLALLEEGDMHIGMNDMSLSQEINQSFIQTHQDYIKEFHWIIVDNNVTEEALTELASILEDQVLILDAVSMTKAPKLLSILNRIDYLKVNKEELQVLTKSDTVEEQLEELASAGVKKVIVTNKADDIILYKDHTLYSYPVIPSNNIVNTSGCGDAFLSGFVYGLVSGLTEEECINYGRITAHQTLLVKESVNEKVKIDDK